MVRIWSFYRKVNIGPLSFQISGKCHHQNNSVYQSNKHFCSELMSTLVIEFEIVKRSNMDLSRERPIFETTYV